MFKRLCKHYSFVQPIFTPKTYKNAVTYNHASADGNLLFNQDLRKHHETKFEEPVWKVISSAKIQTCTSNNVASK